MIRILAIVSCLFLFSSCRCSSDPELPNVESENVEKTESAIGLMYEMKEQSLSYQDCEGDFRECTQVLFSYPNFKNPELVGINSLVLSIISNPELALGINPEIGDAALQDSAAQFIASYAEFKAEFAETSQSWYWIGDVEVNQQIESIFNLKFSMEIFSGGAHQIVKEQYINVLMSGKLVVADDVFVANSEDKISLEIEKAFRKQQLLDPNQSLTQAGLFKDEIPFTKNMQLIADGILFHYNPYEIAPWTSGPIDVVVSYTSLEALMQPQWKELISSANRIN